MVNIKSEPRIEELLNQAVSAGVRAVEGELVTTRNLARAAWVAREAVLVQADLGMWREFAVVDRLDLTGLTCEFVVTARGPLNVPQYIAPRWNFSRTQLRFLATTCDPPAPMSPCGVCGRSTGGCCTVPA